MSEDRMEYFRIAQELNNDCRETLKAKKFHFRGSRGSFALISLDRITPEQGKGGFKDKEQGRRFLAEKCDSHFSKKTEKIDAGRSKSTPEKELQAWIIDYAFNNDYSLPFSKPLTFLTSELAFSDPGKIVNDILAIDQEGSLVVIELKTARDKKTLEGQVDAFCRVIDCKVDFFKELVPILAPGKVWNERVRKLIVWPDANGKPRMDWIGDVEEVRYLRKRGDNGRFQIAYNEEGNIVFLE